MPLYRSLLYYSKGTWRQSVRAAPLHHCHLMLILKKLTVRAVVLKGFSCFCLVSLFFVFDRIPVQRMSPRPHTLRPCGHKGNSSRASVFPQVAARALRNQGPVSVCGWNNSSCWNCMLFNQCVNCSEMSFCFCFYVLLPYSSTRRESWYVSWSLYELEIIRLVDVLLKCEKG